MEIDFLGLNSPRFKKFEPEGPKDAFTGSEVETSLSLSTSSSLDSQREILHFAEKKKTSWDSNGRFAHYNQETAPNTEHNGLVFIPSPVYHPSLATGFLYDLSEQSTNLRNMSELPPEPTSLAMVYASRANVFNEQKVDNTMYMPGNASTQLPNDARSTKGHTPTVAMARRATLARFLEKRLHRMNKARTAQLMGKSLNATNSEACNTTTTRNNMRNNRLIR